jgi:hypothetical protein
MRPIDIGDRVLKIRNMCRKRSGRPRSRMSSGAPPPTAPVATIRAVRAERSSRAISQASAANAAPVAIPPNQKYSGTSHVHTGARIIPCETPASGGMLPVARSLPAYAVSSP